MVDVSVEPTADGRFLAKLQTPTWEVNVWLSRDEADALRGIRDADWDARASIRAGESAGAPVFWACDGTTVSLLIGHDDETWDVAVELPLATVDALIAEVVQP